MIRIQEILDKVAANNNDADLGVYPEGLCVCRHSPRVRPAFG